MLLDESLKNKTLKDLAALIAANKEEIIKQNQLDLKSTARMDPTLYDRLRVDAKKVEGMVAAVEEVIALEDPQGKVISEYTHPNGILVQNKIVPFGKILIIYESRPDVTIEAAISAFKAGNKIVLKGGKEAVNTNLYLVSLWHQALEQNGIDKEVVEYLNISREETQKLLRENTHKLDLIIPRGGEGLINYIKTNTAVPLIISGRGNNFIYIHKDADFDMAIDLVLNGKSRLSVCNAIDKVLIDKGIKDLDKKVSRLVDALFEKQLQVYGDGEYFSWFRGVKAMEHQAMYAEEFLSEKILLGLVENMPTAIETINAYSGGHSAVIVTEDATAALAFQHEVDCAAVYHNASSRFTDGGQFGFGAEIAISTQKLHFRGPVGLGQLVTNKWFIQGQGQIRN
ncbi:glutamate-5-semialdehyde dehydrogenase [Algivirga pacifica]|uniref:Gamma-glutamyl phosphate reductase n=1 Tax=Algivirga pacifica TaxID=1162670 RepID=A0ABP9DFT8_9BACT